MGDGLQSVERCLFIASSRGASPIPDLLMLPPAAFCFPFWIHHSIRQDCVREATLSGQICARSDKFAGREDLPKPRQKSQPSGSCAAQLWAWIGSQRSSLASDQSWDSIGHFNSVGCFHLQSCRFKCSLEHGPLAKENELIKCTSFKNKWNGTMDMWNDFGSEGKKPPNISCCWAGPQQDTQSLGTGLLWLQQTASSLTPASEKISYFWPSSVTAESLLALQAGLGWELEAGEAGKLPLSPSQRNSCTKNLL